MSTRHTHRLTLIGAVVCALLASALTNVVPAGARQRTLAGAPAASSAAILGANGPIAFERFATKHEDDRTAQIFVRSPSGAVRQITHFRGGAFNPAWSPDGARIAFDRWFVAQRQPDQILTMNADGSDARPLTSGCTAANCLADDSPSYSPDGSQIAFVRLYKPLVEDRPSAADLMLVPAAGGAPRVLRHFAGDPIPLQPAWSPDGTRLVFALETAKQPTKQTDVLGALNVLDVAGGAMTQITPIALGASDPDWSPDGSRIVFNSQGGHSPFVYVVRPDGSGLRRITRRTRVFSLNPSDPPVALVAQFQPSWSPDGRQILFTNEPKPCSGHHRDSCSRDPKDAQPRNVFAMNVDGTGVRRLTRSPRFEGQPAWARAS